MARKSTHRLLPISLILIAATATPALAHLDPLEHGSLAAGFTHPLTGVDHLLAMVTVGVWAALVGGRALWTVPAAFVLAMLSGFALALTGVSLPLVEPTVLASIVVLGLLAAMALPMPGGLVAAIVAAFAVFHGYAHGSELGAAGALPYAAGFAVATAALHAAGVWACLAFASVLGADRGRLAARVAGGAAAAGGLALAVL